MNGALLFGAAVGFCVLIGFVATWRLIGQRDPVESRLRQFGGSARSSARLEEIPGAARRPSWSGTTRMLSRSGLGPRLANRLAQADLPLTAAEFTMVMVACFVVGALAGVALWGPGPGIVLGLVAAWLPILYLNYQRRRRQKAFTNQVSEVLTLLSGALRAGHGISQAMSVAVNQLAPPASVEFSRAIRAVALGLPLQRALTEMAARLGTDEAAMIVTAIIVQHASGGNLAQTLDTVGDTVRDRLRVKAQVQTYTAQQRLTGFILAGAPIALAVILSILNPGYMQVFFEPGIMRILLIGTVVMMAAGFFVISRIVDIEV